MDSQLPQLKSYWQSTALSIEHIFRWQLSFLSFKCLSLPYVIAENILGIKTVLFLICIKMYYHPHWKMAL